MKALPNGSRAVRQPGAVLLAFFAFHAVLALAEPGTAEAVRVPCADSSIVVAHADRQDADDVCRGARRAIEFFRSLGLHADEPIVVEITRQMPDSVSPGAAGAFLKSTRRVLLQSYDRFEANQTWFHVPIDRSLYQSAAAHEIAHALAFNNFSIPAPTLVAMEYVAYVTQFVTMPESQRRVALAGVLGEARTAELQLTEILYLFDPMRFGAEAYRHFLRPENGRAFFHAIFAGAALAD